MTLDQEHKYCIRCGEQLDGRLKCAACQYEQPLGGGAAGIKCYNCHAQAPRQAAFCPTCGQPFTLIHPISFDVSNTEVAPEDAPSENGLVPVTGADNWEPVPDELLSTFLPWKEVNTERVFESGLDSRIGDTTFVARKEAYKSVPVNEEEVLLDRGAVDRDGITGQYASLVSRRGEPTPLPRDAPSLDNGAVIAGRYQVTRSLGRGGFANIYLVTDSEDYLQEELVLKLVDENLMRELLSQEGEVKLETHEDLLRAWRSKLKAWKVISEQEPDHIVRLLGVPRIIFGRDDSHSVGILMEYMPGGDLWQYFRKHGAPHSREQLTVIMRLFLSACRAVAVLHANKLLHRDIKPSNFLLSSAANQCKLSDFELIVEADERSQMAERLMPVGTLIYMAPECFEGKYSFQSDIFALGAMLYHLLAGHHPRNNMPDFHAFTPKLREHRPEELTRLNPLVSSELNEAVLWCLEGNPTARPGSVRELEEELIRLGLTGEAVNIAPVNLARLLITQLPESDVRDLVESLEDNGFHSASTDDEQRQKDIIEEYCYTASPYDVLRDNCTTRQLKDLIKSLGPKNTSAVGREDLIEGILTSVGFLARAREVPDIEATRTFLENLRLNLAHATTMDECVGMIQAGLSACERTVDLLLSFYGQLLLGTKLSGFLKKMANGKPSDRLTFGEKLGALRKVCSDEPPSTLPSRIRNVFSFPLIPTEVFDRFGEVVKQRNLVAHSPRESTRRTLSMAQRSGRQLLEHAVACLTELAKNKNVPRVVQIVSRQDDIYGRHFYLGRDQHGRSERIFTPLPLSVGRLYLFFPLTNPARINPLIFPFEMTDVKSKS